MNDSSIDDKVWKKRIDASRSRRKKFEGTWAKFALLFTNLYTAKQQLNDDDLVTLPEGDQVKVGLIFRNIEQTLGMLEVPEIGVRVTETDYTRELTQEDSHREAVVEQGLILSLSNSGFVSESEEVDDIKRDGLILGHGINYSQWKIVEDEVEVPSIPMMHETDSGFEPMLDEVTGEQMLESQTEKVVAWEGVEDLHILPTQFLFSSSAKKIHKSPWHGYEDVVDLDELRKNTRLTIPEHITGTAFQDKDLYGNKDDNEFKVENGVKVITIFDKTSRELLIFIEADSEEKVTEEKSSGFFGRKKTSVVKKGEKSLYLVSSIKYPVKFSHPDASPFTFFIPQPANDHPMGISQIEHIRNQATEVDKLRTRAANLTRQLKTIIFYQKGKIDTEQFKEAMAQPEGNPVGIDLQEGDSWKDMIKEIKIGELHPEIYQQISQGMNDVNQTTGVAEQPFSGADTATESDNQMSIAGVRPKRKQRLLLKFMSEVASRHKDFLAAFAPEGQVIRFFSMDGQQVIQPYGREAFNGKFAIEILSGGGATNISPVKQKIMAETFSLIKGQFGPKVDLMFLRQVLTMTDARDINGIMKAAQEALGQGFGMPVDGPQGNNMNINPNDLNDGQAIRAAINMASEGGLQ